MRRNRPLVAELLEGRTLLSSLSYTLTTDQSVYQVGQTIQLTFTETNISNQPVTIEVSPTDFDVSQSSYAVWQSGPGDGSQPPVQETLLPGQSVQQTATWDGTTADPFDGPTNSMTPQINNFGTFSVSNPNGPQGLSATFQITNPITNTLTTDKPVYQLGEPVQVSFTEVNTAPVPITIHSPPAEATDIFQNGSALWGERVSSSRQRRPACATSGANDHGHVHVQHHPGLRSLYPQQPDRHVRRWRQAPK